TEKSFLQQAESGNVAVEIEYHKQTIDSINVAIAKNETEQNKLKLDAIGFNQTPESQVLLQQLKEKFPHLWQSETQEQGISASEVPENSQETQPETLSGSPETEKQGISASEISETVAVQHDLTGQPENPQGTFQKNREELLRLAEKYGYEKSYDGRMYGQTLTCIVQKDIKIPFDENPLNVWVAVRVDEKTGVSVGFHSGASNLDSRVASFLEKNNIEKSAIEAEKKTFDTVENSVLFSEKIVELLQSPKLLERPLTKEEKAELKTAKDDLTVAKKELKDLRDKLKNTRPDPMSDYLQCKEEKRQAISQKQSEVRERSHQYDELSFAFKTKTGEITDLEKEILTARLSGSLKERFDIAFRELRTQKKEIGAEYDALKLRIENKDFYEFEIQSVMQDAVAYYGGSRGMATLYHKGEPLPLTTDREKAIAYLLQVELPTQLHDELGKPYNALARKISKLGNAEYYIKHGSSEWGKDIEAYIDLLEDTENQLMKGSIEERAEINLTYDINTPDGEQKVRELFYGSRHDEAQAELFERVFAMAQKLNVEVRHALRNPHTTFSKRNATTMVAGWYQLNENSARVKHGGNIQVEEKGEVLLHELVHSVTSRAIVLKEQGHTELLNPAQVKAIDEIEKIYKIVLDKAEELGFEKYQTVTENGVETFKGDYGLKNSHEFIAELANPVFREKLKQVAV
ncbi:MAG: hypothetical protein IJV56_09580, partial [Neisseriaceae bacterium]|nr:hypothetical protein [Neisseriaceae bacterium]